MPDIDSIYEQIDNAMMDDSMRFQCHHCGKMLGYMNSSLYRARGSDSDWIRCEDCFGGINKK